MAMLFSRNISIQTVYIEMYLKVCLGRWRYGKICPLPEHHAINWHKDPDNHVVQFRSKLNFISKLQEGKSYQTALTRSGISKCGQKNRQNSRPLPACWFSVSVLPCDLLVEDSGPGSWARTTQRALKICLVS